MNKLMNNTNIVLLVTIVLLGFVIYTSANERFNYSPSYTNYVLITNNIPGGEIGISSDNLGYSSSVNVGSVAHIPYTGPSNPQMVLKLFAAGRVGPYTFGEFLLPAGISNVGYNKLSMELVPKNTPLSTDIVSTFVIGDNFPSMKGQTWALKVTHS